MANIEIDGKKITTREGAMVIEAADEAGIYIPRFCYHKKLSIAANCRMCLVEVEKIGKPLPACATPVTDGMKIFTQSTKALEAQQGVMEFLLINHPLDCPICDQGGECELQDVAMGYGNDVSQFAEKKRVVKDKNLGPLISTDMTRCIHCTRCVRFGEEIAGIRELGATGRGEHMEIGTYVGKSVSSEMSGNVIDLCPVGALTSKPFRFSSRAWEMMQRDTVAPHDCIGSNLKLHVRDNQVMRAVPSDNESINETWLSDRDRFSYEALNSSERLSTPMVKVNGEWQETDWSSALEAVVEGLTKVIEEQGPNNIGVLSSATATVEEMYLLQKLARSLEIDNIDHRIRQDDFSDDALAPRFPWLGQSVPDLERNNAVLLIGSNIRQDQPIAAHRLRKATNDIDAKVMCVNAVDYDFYFPISNKIITNPRAFSYSLAGIVKVLLETSNEPAPQGLAELIASVEVNDNHRAIARHLQDADQASVLLGPQVINHSDASTIRQLANVIAKLSNSSIGYLPESGNSAGAWLTGMIPHRQTSGIAAENIGLDAKQMLSEKLQAYVLFDLEAEVDSLNPNASLASLNGADFVVSFSSFKNDAAQQYADVLLPIAPFTETSGTFINVANQWQSFEGAVAPQGDARPAWKVLRVLGNLFNCEGFAYVNSNEVRDECRQQIGQITENNDISWSCPSSVSRQIDDLTRIPEMQMYAGDSLLRRATALQETQDAATAAIRINMDLANKIGLANGDNAVATQNGNDVTLPVVVDEQISDNSVLIHAGLAESAALGSNVFSIQIRRV